MDEQQQPSDESPAESPALSRASGTKRKTRKKSGISKAVAAVPVEQLLAMKQQLEDLEKTFQEQLAQEQTLTRKLKRKVKTQKATIAELRALQPGTTAAGGAGPRAATSEDFKGANMEILELREALEQSARERSLLVAEKRKAQAEVERLRTELQQRPQQQQGLTSSQPHLSQPQLREAKRVASASETDHLRSRVVLDLSNRKTLSQTYLAEVAEAIKASSVLVSINMSRSKLGAKGAALLAQSIAGHASLASLTLERCSIGDSGLVVIAEALKTVPTLTLLSVRGNRLSSAAVKAVAGSLAHLTSLDLSNCSLRPEHVVTLAAALQAAPNLAYFSLSGNELGVAGARALADAGGLASIATLDLDTCGLTEEAMAFVAAAISKPGSKLTSLNVSRNVCTGAALVTVLRAPHCSLEELVAVGCGLDSAQTAALIDAVASAPTMRRLNVWGAQCAATAAAVGEAVGRSALTQLDVRGVGLGTAKLPLLGAGLRLAPALQSLDVSGNGIGTEGGAALAECATHCKALTRLACNGNNLGNDGVRSLMGGLAKSKITELALQLNMLDDGGVTAFANLPASLLLLDIAWNHIGPSGARDLAPLVLNKLDVLSIEGNNVGGEGALLLLADENTRLRHMNLSCNNLRQEGARAAARLLASPKSALARLDLRKNGFDNDAAAAIASAMRNNATLTQLDMSDNRIAERGAVSLAEMLQLCRYLTSCDVSKNPLGGEGEERIRDAAQRNAQVHVVV